jgi:hypothetical protein
MAENFGASFAPTDDTRSGLQPGQAGRRRLSPSALQVLSLNLPRFISARSSAPSDLLRSPGSGGPGGGAGSAVIESILKAIAGGNVPVPGAGGAGSEAGDLASQLGTKINLPSALPPPAAGAAPLARHQAGAQKALTVPAAARPQTQTPRVKPVLPRPGGAPSVPTPTFAGTPPPAPTAPTTPTATPTGRGLVQPRLPR